MLRKKAVHQASEVQNTDLCWKRRLFWAFLNPAQVVASVQSREQQCTSAPGRRNGLYNLWGGRGASPECLNSKDAQHPWKHRLHHCVAKSSPGSHLPFLCIQRVLYVICSCSQPTTKHVQRQRKCRPLPVAQGTSLMNDSKSRTLCQKQSETLTTQPYYLGLLV